MIPIKKSYDGTDVPSIAVDTNQDDLVPRKKILAEGGAPVEPVIISGNFTENGTYNVPEGTDGYNPVTVNVPQTTVTSLSVTENGTYNAPEGSAYSPVEVNVPAPGVLVTDAEIVKAIPVPVAPDVLPEGKLYMVPNGTQVCPPIPAGFSYNVICINKFDPGQWSDRPSTPDVLNATKFWLYQDSTNAPKTRRDSTTIITWGTGATTSTPPTKILEYDTTGAFEWVDITNEPDTVTAFENNTISHDIRDCCYSDVVINRFTVGNPEYNPESNKINTACKIMDVYYIDNFDCYVVEEGVAVYDDTYTMYQIISNYIGGVNNG